MTSQPIWTSATIVAVVTAIVALLVAFGVELTNEQTAAIVGLTGVLAPLAAALWSNPKVTPRIDPTDEDGTPLIRVDNAPTRAQVRSMSRG